MSAAETTKLNEDYARQRLTRILTDMIAKDMALTWSGLAADVSVWRGIEFSRENFRRLRKGTLGPSNVEIIIRYLEHKHDPNIRERLKPDAIFDELAQPARDYYFHIPDDNNIDEWNEQILQEFGGVYFCCLAGEAHSYMPASHLRKLIHERSKIHKNAPLRSGLASTLFTSRTMLFLRRTDLGFFYAAEIPLAALISPQIITAAQRVFYEGVGVISANTIQIKLRDCLTRIPRTHAITILNKTEQMGRQPHGLSLFTAGRGEKVAEIWGNLDDDEIAELQYEHQIALASEQFLVGKALHSETPLPVAGTKISAIHSVDLIYLPKSADFLSEPERHFFLGDVSDVDTIQKIMENPLVIGTLDEH